MELMVDYITSLDGYGAAEGWPGWWGLESPEYLAWLGEDSKNQRTLLIGAKTYRLMHGFAASQTEGVDELDKVRKIVFSNTLGEPLGWANSQLIRGDAVEAVRELKQTSAQPLSTLGSLSLARSLLEAGLVDRFRVGIMSSIAEFYSKNLATEVTKGLTQKFETGGTPMRAPIGYLNVRKRDEQGREYRTVEIDPERAPLVRWVFEQYAAGERTVVDLLADVTARGLTSVPTPKRPAGPVGRSTFFDLLRNPYYIGIVRYKGAEQTGTHEPLVDVETWQQVQRLLDSRKKASERRRTHDYYLKGSLFCGSCGSRMQLDYPANRQGVRYAYYVCSGRASKRNTCTRRAVPVGIAEQLVADCYRDIAITEEEYAALAAQVGAAFDERLASRSEELAELTANRQRLQNESDKILAAHFADAIDLDTLKRHQDRIRTGLADIDRRLATEHDQHEGSRKQLSTPLSLLVDCANLYARTDEQGKRLANQALTNGIDISEDERATIRLAEPFAALVPEPTSTDVSGSSTSDLVDAMERCGNRRPRIERLVSAWAQGPGSSGEPDSEPDDPLIGAAAEPRGRPRTRLTDEEVDAMRTARANGVSVAALAKQFGVHRGTVWTTTRIKSP